MSTARMTASQAAELADKNDPSKAVDAILADIAEEAQAGRRSLKVRGYGFGDGQCYANREKWPGLCRRIQDELLLLGYQADIHVEERQFVDMWLHVTWGDASRQEGGAT